MANKKYEVENPNEQIILDLISSGVKVNARNWEIVSIEIDDTQHDIKDIENTTKLKFKLKEE